MFIRLLPPGLTAWLHPWPDNELSLVAPYRSRRAPPDRYRAARGALLLALLLGCVGANAQKTRYVTDSLRLEARTGPSTQHRIITMLESGTEVQVQEESEGWSRVSRPGGGDDVWILSRYLMDQPSARSIVEAAAAERNRLKTQQSKLDSTLSEYRKTIAELQQSRDEFKTRSETLASELADLKRTASTALQIRAENDRLKQSTDVMRREYERAKRDYTLLRETRERDWFLAGAGVLFGGMVLGLIIPKIRWKRRKRWNEI